MKIKFCQISLRIAEIYSSLHSYKIRFEVECITLYNGYCYNSKGAYAFHLLLTFKNFWYSLMFYSVLLWEKEIVYVYTSGF